MKRLLIALAAAVAVSTASAIITDTQLFEDNFTDFIAEGDDESELATHETAPSITVPYPCENYGSKYLSLDTGDATLWRTNNAAGNVYFDMALQFNPSASAPELEQGDPTKILLYQNTESNLVILAGTSASDRTPTSYVTTTKVAPGTWARVTVSSELGNDGYAFTVRLNGTALETAGGVVSFPSLTADTTITKVGFAGSGALDDFVARTTDPYLNAYAAKIGSGEWCEKYPTYTKALADALIGTPATITISDEADPVDGSAAYPYQIPNADCLKVLQDAVLTNPAARSLHYVQTQNIDMTGVAGFYGIGWYGSSTAYLSLPEGVSVTMDTKKNVPKSTTSIPFEGVYDGAGYTISNVTLVRHNYGGVFNLVSGTIKNLTVQNLGFNDVETASADNGELEWGCGIVGNAQSNAVLANLTSAGTVWGNTANHNIAGISVRAQDNATITGCVNNVAIASASKRLGGIVAFTGTTAADDAVTIVDCINNGNLTSTDGTRGVGGILSSPETGKGANTVIEGCSNFGTLTAGQSGFTGYIVGSLGVNTNSSYTDGGGNTFLASGNMLGTRGLNIRAIEGLAFALPTTISGDDYLTTVAQEDLAAGNTYLLVADVAASETPVYTFDAAGTIAFDTALGYTFAGTVAAGNGMIDVTDATAGTVTTYTAVEGTVVATITKSGNTTSYNTLQKALAAAESGDTVNLVENAAISGEVNIPANVTVVLASGVSLANVTALSGTGVLFAPSGTVVPLVQTDHAAGLLQDAEKWAGTLFIKDATMSGPDGLAYYGNANSTVRFENVWLSNFTSSHAIGTLELVGAGVYIQAASGNMILPCALVGDGAISLRDSSATQRTVLFSGDVSAFAGNVTVATDTKSRIVFGTNAGTLGNDNCIVVDSGAAVTVAEGKTWTAPNGYVIKGTVTVSGTLAAGSEKVYGTGCVIYTSATAAAASAPIAGSWTGTYVVGWAPTGAFNPNTYGNANSTVVLSNDLAASAYFGPGSATTLTINPTVRIATDVEIKNGYSKADDSCLVTFTKLTGDHKFSTSPGTGGTDANPTTRRYAITTLDNFTGSLKVKAGSELRIATVNVADGTNLSGLIIPAECDAKSTVEGAHADGVITGALALTVAGVDSGKTLTYDANGAEGAGLYVVASSGGFDGGDGATFNIPAETQATLAAVLPSGKTLADTADAASGMTYAQAYALGLLNETTGDVEDLKATIEVVGGKVKVSLDATAGAAYTVTLKVYEKASLTAAWPDTPKTTYTLGSEEETAGFTPGSGSAPAGFYKVGISISNQQ